ncbi:MAG: hypothetical protein K6G00_08540 [Treponema sp.]|nr:hypothetical protein [Treponema sp.]
MNQDSAEKNYITFLPQHEYEKILSQSNAILYADLRAESDEAKQSLKNVCTFAEFLFDRIHCKGISPIAALLLQQKHNFDAKKGEDLISGTISSVCSLSGTPVKLLIGNADAVQESDAFKAFLALLSDKYSDRENFPTFESVTITRQE